ncbi:hypothetical protein [Gordonia alkaliphila]|uniref:Uncharacterized protein n=1 Tax=Gordonia alkaliphila TaxID=1053547 RepID=A0ABP8ZK59_9ACTN
MSGPKGIEYQIAQERRALESARRRMIGLAARNKHLQQRGALHGVSVPNVAVPANPPGNSVAVQAACSQVEAQLRAAEEVLEAALGRRAVQAVTFDVDDELARLVAEDDATRATASRTRETAAPPQRAAFDTDAHSRDVAERLRSARNLTPEVQAIAKSALACGTAEEARMSLSGLSSAIAAADRQAERAATQVRTQRAELAELRTATGALLDPDSLLAELDGVERLLDDGADIAVALDHIRAAITEQSAAESDESDRRLVLAEVKNALAELGYTPVDVAVATPGTVVRQPHSSKHAVRINVTGGEIGLETVLTPGAASTPAENRAADQALCGDLDQLLTSLDDAGVGHGRVRKIPAGLVQPAELGDSGEARTEQPTTRSQQRTEPVRRRRPQQRGGAQ